VVFINIKNHQRKLVCAFKGEAVGGKIKTPP